MARPESNPETRQGKTSNGARRALPISKVHLNGQLDPDASVEDLREYLGVTTPIEGYSRNFGRRGSGKFKLDL